MPEFELVSKEDLNVTLRQIGKRGDAIIESLRNRERRLFGPRASTLSQAERDECMTWEERGFEELWEFFQGQCRGHDAFASLFKILPFEALVKEMQAVGCLEALERLGERIRLYDSLAGLGDAISLGGEAERALAERLIEPCEHFGSLLVEWAEGCAKVGDGPAFE